MYQEYSVAIEVGTVIVGMVIDGKVAVGIESSVLEVKDIGVIEGSVIDDGGGTDAPVGQTTSPLEIAQ